MTDNPTAATTTTTSTSPSPAPAGTAGSADLFSRGAPPPVNDRSHGHSPAMEARAQQVEQPGANKVRVLGAEHDEQHVADALTAWSEAQVRKQGLPQSPDGYEIKLPADWKAPAGVQFEFDKSDGLLARARELAHARGIDQDTFSDMLGIYAANKIAEATQINTARTAELQKLGSASDQRLGMVETWLKAMTGSKATPIIAQLKAYPHAGMIEMFEGLISRFSNQGGVGFSQSHRNNEQPEGRIAGYEGMSFAQRRVAQMSRNPAAPRGGRE